MAAEKCFCHLNGYKVKDADAQAKLASHETLIQGLTEGVTELTEACEGKFRVIDDNTEMCLNNGQRLLTVEEKVTALESAGGSGSSSGSLTLYKYCITFDNSANAVDGNEFIQILVLTTYAEDITGIATAIDVIRGTVGLVFKCNAKSASTTVANTKFNEFNIITINVLRDGANSLNFTGMNNSGVILNYPNMVYQSAYKQQVIL